VYCARDGKWLAVGAIEPKFFGNLCTALGLPDLAKDQMNDERQEFVRSQLSKAFLTKDRGDWVRELGDADCCVTPVLSIAEVSEDIHLNARDVFSQIDGPDGEKRRQVAPVIAGALRGDRYEAVDPTHTDTAELLARTGLDSSDIEALIKEVAIE
jgi:alpha-methylacyl-CoA racemase